MCSGEGDFTAGGPFMKEHVHVLPNTEIVFTSGSYTFQKEGRLPYENRELLYIEGVTTAGSVCCGAVECRIIHVLGLIVSWRCKVDRASGNPVSEIDPVTDPVTREDIRRLIYRTFPSSLVMLES
jgi:hypothetical protein